ncbi:universal stress protein [Corynebacterium sp. 335C]
MSSTPLRVLVAWRPGAAGGEVMAHAAWLARTCRVRIRTVAVLSRGWPLTSLARLGDDDSWARTEIRATEKAIRAAGKAHGIRKGMLDESPTLVVEAANEAGTIADAARDFGADVVLLGTRAHSPSGHFRAGATADALLHHSPVPVGLTPRAPKLSKNGVTRVTCTYLDTAQSHRALERAADLAMAWDVPLRLLALTPRGATMYPTDSGFGSDEDLIIEWQEQAMALLDRGQDRALTRHPELRLQLEVGSGHGWEGAVGSVKWKKGDLTVIGSSGLGPFGRVFTGTSVNHMVKHVPSPMLITPA